MMQKLKKIILEEYGNFQWRWQVARLLMLLLPIHSGNRLRAFTLRIVGFRIGRGTLIQGMPIIFGPGKWGSRLSMGKYCVISIQISFDLAAPITVGEAVHVGPRTMFVTGGHEMGGPICRSGTSAPKPIHLEDGVWVGSRCMILPGVTVGRGAVVAAGSVVTKDVPPNTLVAGIPAVIKKQLDEG